MAKHSSPPQTAPLNGGITGDTAVKNMCDIAIAVLNSPIALEIQVCINDNRPTEPGYVMISIIHRIGDIYVPQAASSIQRCVHESVIKLALRCNKRISSGGAVRQKEGSERSRGEESGAGAEGNRQSKSGKASQKRLAKRGRKVQFHKAGKKVVDSCPALYQNPPPMQALNSKKEEGKRLRIDEGREHAKICAWECAEQG